MLKCLLLALAVVTSLCRLTIAETSSAPNSAQTQQYGGNDDKAQMQALRAQISQIDQQLKPQWDQIRQIYEQMKPYRQQIQSIQQQMQPLLEQRR